MSVKQQLDDRDVDYYRGILENEFQEQISEDIELEFTPGLRAFATVFSKATANDTIPLIEEVYDAAFLDTAEGDHLDRLLALIGINREPASRATGVIVFERDTRANQSYTIQAGTEIYSDGDNRIVFETRNPVTLRLYDDFVNTSISTYSGDTNQFDITDDFSVQGEYAVRGSDGAIYDDTLTNKGRKMSVETRLSENAVSRTLFGVDSIDDTYYVEIDESNSVGLYVRENGSDTVLDEDISVTIPTNEWLEVVIDWRLEGEIVIEIYDNTDNLITTLTANDDTYFEGGYGFEAETENVYWDYFTSYSVPANIRAIEGGANGNVTANVLTTLPSLPSGIQRAYNPFSTGNADRTDLNDNAYVVGENRETDEELRDRAMDSVGEAASSTVAALQTQLSMIDGVQSVTIFENTDAEMDEDGLPPVSFEAVILGGNDDEILQTIFDTRAATASSVGGVHATEFSGVVESSMSDQTFVESASRPNEVTIEIDLNIVVTDEYAGNTVVSDQLVEYIGGTLSNGTSTINLGLGDDVKVDRMRDAVVNGVTGVEGIIDMTITPTTTTDSNGLEVVAINDDEVASLDVNDVTVDTVKE